MKLNNYNLTYDMFTLIQISTLIIYMYGFSLLFAFVIVFV